MTMLVQIQQHNSTGFAKFFVVAIFVGIWAINQIIAAANKKREKDQRDSMRQSMVNDAMLPIPEQAKQSRRPPIQGSGMRVPSQPFVAQPMPTQQQRQTQFQQELVERASRRPIRDVLRETPPLDPQILRRLPRGAAAFVKSQQPGAIAPPRNVPRAISPSISAPARPALAPMPAVKQAIAATEIRSIPTAGKRSTTGQIDAAALHRWLNPTTLRQQFMLTELLNKPVAMRDNHLQ